MNRWPRLLQLPGRQNSVARTNHFHRGYLFGHYHASLVQSAQDSRRRSPDYQGCRRHAAGRRARQVFLDNPQRTTDSVHSRTGEILIIVPNRPSLCRGRGRADGGCNNIIPVWFIFSRVNTDNAVSFGCIFWQFAFVFDSPKIIILV